MRKQTYILAFCVFILATGGYTAMPLFVEMKKIHGISLVQVGLLTSVYILAQKVTPLGFGPIGDHFGHKKLACIGEFLRGAGFIGLAVTNPYIGLLAFTALAGIGGGAAGPSLKALMMLSAEPRFRPRVSALRTTAVNVALVAGPGLAGLVIYLGYFKGIFLAAGICYFIGACLIVFLADSEIPPKTKTAFSFTIYKEILQNHRFLHLLVFMFFIWILFAQLFVTLPNYAKYFTPHIEQIFLINGIMGILLEYPIGCIISKAKKADLFLPFGTMLFALSFLTMGFVANLMGLYVGIVLFTLGELLTLPVAETMVANLSDGDKNMASYYGASSLSDGLGRPTGSFLGALLFGLIPSVSPGWYVFAVVSCGLLIYYFVVLKLNRKSMSAHA